MVVRQRLVASSDDFLGSDGCNFNGKITVHQDFRLNNGNEAVLLANGRIASQSLSVLIDSKLCKRTRLSPISE